MSSVGSSDSSNASKRSDGNDNARRSAEASKKREGELAKKQAAEVRRINEQHYAELEGMKKSHQSQMANLRSDTHEAISQRDHKNMQEIEGVRDVYRKQLQEQAEESSRREGQLRKATGNDNSQLKNSADNRIQRMAEDFQKNLNDKQEMFNETLAENRQKQRQAIDDNREGLTRHYEGELSAVKEERAEKVSGLQKGYEDYRSSAESRLKDQEIRHFQDQRRGSNAMLRAVNKERFAAQDTQEQMREGFKDGINKTQERFAQKDLRERELNHAFRDQMKAGVIDRINNQVSRLENENDDLKNVGARKEMNLKQNFAREKMNLANAFQKNMDAYKNERDEAVRQANEGSHRDVAHVRGELEQLAVETNRGYRSRQDELNKINTLAFDNLKRDTEMRHKATQDTADVRVMNLYNQTAEEKNRLIELQKQNHIASQHSHQDDLRNLRNIMDNDKQIAVAAMSEHIQSQEIKHADRMNQVVSKYEKQVQGLKDDLMRVRKENDADMKRVVDEMQRQHKLALDQMDAKSRDQLRQVNKQHSEELRTQSKRGDDKLEQLLGEIKRS